MEAGAEGFPVGKWTEDRDDGYESWGLLFRMEDRNSVGCYVGSISGVAEVFVAPAVSLRRLLDGVTLEDGGSPLAAGAQVEARAESKPLSDGSGEDAWRTVPVQVTVRLAGYEDLRYDFRLADPVEPRVMARREP